MKNFIYSGTEITIEDKSGNPEDNEEEILAVLELVGLVERIQKNAPAKKVFSIVPEGILQSDNLAPDELAK